MLHELKLPSRAPYERWKSGITKGRHEGRVVAVRYRKALLAGAGREHHHAVGSLRAIEGGRRGTRQHGHVAYIVGVEHRDAVTRRVRRPHDGIRSRRGCHRKRRERNTVKHIKGVVVVVDGLRTAHDDLGFAADTGRTAVDLHAGDAAREVVGKADVLGLEDLVGHDILYVVRHGSLGPLDAEGGHDDGLKLLVVLQKRNIEHRTPCNGYELRDIADERYIERRAGNLLAPGEIEHTVDVGRRTQTRRSCHKDGGPDDRHSVFIDDSARQPIGLCRLGVFFSPFQNNVPFIDGPGDPRSAEELGQGCFEIAAMQRKIHMAHGFDILGVVKKVYPLCCSICLITDATGASDTSRVMGWTSWAKSGDTRTVRAKHRAQTRVFTVARSAETEWDRVSFPPFFGRLNFFS